MRKYILTPDYMGRILKTFFVFLLVFQFASAVNDFDSFKPYLHQASVGDVPKLQTFGEYETQLFQGSGSYTYVIDVVPGTVSLQPALSLKYNSQAILQRPGILGSGWSLTENSIIREINHTSSNSSDDYFVLTLNNNHLRFFYNGTRYNTEIDPMKFRIENFTIGGKIYWIVTTVDGTR